MTLEDLVSKTNAWCDKRGLVPANGQSARSLSERTLRYYRTLGLIDPPDHGGGSGYGGKHFHQLIAIRILQAQGLPLNRVQTLLYGRTAGELRAIADRAGSAAPAISQVPFGTQPGPQPCPAYSLGDGFVLVCGNGRPVAPDVLRAMIDLVSGTPAFASARHDPKPTTHRRTIRK